MPGYTVETLTIDGKWVPKDGVFQYVSYQQAAVETFEAKLKGMWSRIVEWPKGRVAETIPPRGL